jgi:hypothetical protein
VTAALFGRFAASPLKGAARSHSELRVLSPPALLRRNPPGRPVSNGVLILGPAPPIGLKTGNLQGIFCFSAPSSIRTLAENLAVSWSPRVGLICCNEREQEITGQSRVFVAKNHNADPTHDAADGNTPCSGDVSRNVTHRVRGRAAERCPSCGP